MVRVQHLFFYEGVHGGQAASAGDHGATLDMSLPRTRSGVTSGVLYPDDEVLQQIVGRDGGLELREGGRVFPASF